MLKVRWNTDQAMKMYRLQMYVVISTVLSKWIYSCVIWMTSSNTTYICPFIVMLVLIISKFIWGQILIILFTQFIKIKETMKLWVQLHLCTLYSVISCTFSLDQTDSLKLSFFFLLKFRNETEFKTITSEYAQEQGYKSKVIQKIWSNYSKSLLCMLLRLAKIQLGKVIIDKSQNKRHNSGFMSLQAHIRKISLLWNQLFQVKITR